MSTQQERERGLMVALALDTTTYLAMTDLVTDRGADAVLDDLVARGYLTHTGGGAWSRRRYRLSAEGIKAAASLLLRDMEPAPKATICTVCLAFNCPCAIRAREESTR